MKIIKDLWWFFCQEKRRYLIGIISLSLVAVLNLIPPKVMGTVIDRVTAGDLTHSELLLNLLWLVLSAVAMYFCVTFGACTFLERLIVWGKLCALGFLTISQKCRRVFIKNTEQVI